MYAILTKYLEKVFKKKTIFKYGFNISPMYKRSTGKITYVSDDLSIVDIKIKLSYKNSNYVGSIFGGSLFSATDPIYMIQLLNILGNDYIVWDKESQIKFKRPAKSDAYGSFVFTKEELSCIKENVQKKNEINLVKKLQITNNDKSIVFAEVSKTIYVANKTYYKEKRKEKA